MAVQSIAIFWFRRDLRLEDNCGLWHALTGDVPVAPIFIFDKKILDQLPKDDARVTFIHQTLERLQQQLTAVHSTASLSIFYEDPEKVFAELLQNDAYDIKAIYTNHDYEPYAIDRDTRIQEMASLHDVAFHTFKDQVIFEKNEIVKNDGAPYVVYTPYKNKWKTLFDPKIVHLYDSLAVLQNTTRLSDVPSHIPLSAMGFSESSIKVPAYTATPTLIAAYEDTRNYPALPNGTSRLGPHLRFGTVSVRAMVQKAIASENEVFWSELIWREFFMQILWHFPHTHTKAFKPKYDRIEWRNNEMEFEAWKAGKTGYPLVDAGMRELNQTGYMHNRVRMLVASFLCKHLLIDWRWGEAYFAEKLLDYDMSANVGNWQWAAGSGVDAAPYFRIFNPTTQIQKFDKQLGYINKWVPDLNEFSYPTPIVDHKMARERCLTTYKEAVA